MPLCSKCQVVRKPKWFSTAQRKKSANKRKCKQCQDVVPFDVKKRDLFTWLKDNGCNINNVSLKDEDGCRCLYSNRRLKIADNVLYIHKSCMLRETDSYDCVSGKILQEIYPIDGENVPTHTFMAMYLLEEQAKQENSFFAPYIAMLPTISEYKKSMPLFMVDIPKSFKGSFYKDMTISHKTSISNEYYKLKKKFPDLMCDYALEDFMWARTAIVTRVFSCDSKDDSKGEHEECLVPVADMMNHSHETTTDWKYVKEQEGFVMSCSNHIMKTSQLFDSYGAKCNSRYFINYGFTLDNNQSFNQAVIHVSIKTMKQNPLQSCLLDFIGDPMSYDDGYSGFDKKLENCNRFQISTINADIQHGHNSGKRNVLQCISSLFTCARMLACETKEEVDVVYEYLETKKEELFNEDNKMHPSQMMEFFRHPLAWYNLKVVSFANEKRALGIIADCCRQELLKFPTTMEEDLIYREEKCQRFTFEYNIQNMLISEKEVLNYYIRLNDAVDLSSFRKLRKNNDFKIYYKMFCSRPNEFLAAYE